MAKSTEPSVDVQDESTVVIRDVETDDGRIVTGKFRMKGSIQRDGIGSYEFWGQRCYDRGTPTWYLDDYRLIAAWDENNNQINLKDPVNKPVVDALDSEMESQRDYIEEVVNDIL